MALKFGKCIQEKRRDLSLLISQLASPNAIGQMKKKQYAYAVYARALRRRPHAHDTYTGGVPVLSSLFLEIGDFVMKDESGKRSLVPAAVCSYSSELVHRTKQIYNLFSNKEERGRGKLSLNSKEKNAGVLLKSRILPTFAM